MNLQELFIEYLSRQINERLESLILEVLQKKGYQFGTMGHLLKHHVISSRETGNGQTFYIDGQPFFYCEPDLSLESQSSFNKGMAFGLSYLYRCI